MARIVWSGRVGDANQQLAARPNAPSQFLDSFFVIRDMFEHLSAKTTIKRSVLERQIGQGRIPCCVPWIGKPGEPFSRGIQIDIDDRSHARKLFQERTV
jgi:hypothetical protein